jgi:signal transduction histidine kinase
MRERAQALGGTITAGPRPEGGFQIRAFFPTNRVAASVEVPDQ